MFEVGIYEAKAHLAEIIRKVEAGEECIVTRRGKQIAKISPMPQDKENIRKAWKELRDFVRANPINATLEEMMEWKNEGRK